MVVKNKTKQKNKEKKRHKKKEGKWEEEQIVMVELSVP